MDDFSELEYKYKADEVGLSQFQDAMTEVQFIKKLDVSSWDYYFVKDNSEDFVRFRDSSSPELTKKIKTKNSNNWNRIEVDLPLDRERLNVLIVKKFLELEGYTRETKLYKSCFIYWTNTVNYVYYIVYDKDLKELGRFIEVEVNKDKVIELNDQPDNSAEGELNKSAENLLKLGLTPQHRLKKSLFEMFVKGKT